MQRSPPAYPHFPGGVMQPSQLSCQPTYTLQLLSTASRAALSIDAHTTCPCWTFVAYSPGLQRLLGALVSRGWLSVTRASGTPGFAFAQATNTSGARTLAMPTLRRYTRKRNSRPVSQTAATYGQMRLTGDGQTHLRANR